MFIVFDDTYRGAGFLGVLAVCCCVFTAVIRAINGGASPAACVDEFFFAVRASADDGCFFGVGHASNFISSCRFSYL